MNSVMTETRAVRVNVLFEVYIIARFQEQLAISRALCLVSASHRSIFLCQFKDGYRDYRFLSPKLKANTPIVWKSSIHWGIGSMECGAL